MTENEDRVVIVKHVVTTEEVKVPLQTIENKEADKWCCKRIHEARKRNANDCKKCWSEVIQILLESCGVLVVFILENLIGIVFLILGIVFVSDCPISPAIPISLIVFGVSSMIHGVMLQLVRWKYFNLKDQKDGFANLAQVIILIASIVHCVALLIACYLVFHSSRVVKTQEEHKGTELYCHPFLYWFSYYFFLVMAIIGFILLVMLCCLCLCVMTSAVPLSTPQVVVIHQNRSGNDPNSNAQSVGKNQPTTAQEPVVSN